MKSFGQGLLASSGRRALPYADLRKAFGQKKFAERIFFPQERRRGLPSRCAPAALAGPLPLIKGDSRREASLPAARLRRLRARSPLIKGDSYFDSRVKCGNGAALTGLQPCLIGLRGNTGRCPVL